MRRLLLGIVLLVGITVGVLLLKGTATAQNTEQSRCFPETGYCISGDFRRYWETQGGLPVFGYPISGQGKEVNSGNGKTYTTQWFERHRMELHPENRNDPNYYILLGFLGKESFDAAQARSQVTSVAPNPFLQGRCRTLQTGSVCGRFRDYWDRYGLNFGPNETERSSLALHGLPITGVRETVVQGNRYQVQWFERARFEWHGPGTASNKPIGNYDVLFGLLGRERIPANRTASTPAPNRMQQAMRQAGGNALNFSQVAPINLQSGAGSSLVLVPPTTPPAVSPEELAANPAILSGVVIGGLQATTDVGDIPADAYTVTLREDGLAVRLTNASGDRIEIPAVIRSLPSGHASPATTYVPLPVEAVQQSGFNRQVCYSWGRTQVCALFTTGENERDRARLDRALGELGLNQNEVQLSQSITLVAGAASLDQCARAFFADSPDYRACTSAVLAAPAVGPEALRVEDPAPDLGVVVAQSNIGEQVYADAAFQIPVEELPTGTYIAEAVVFTDDQPVPAQGTYSRVRLTGAAGTFYMPAIVGVSANGEVVGRNLAGTPPANIAIGTSLIIRNTCFFKVAECPVDISNVVHPIPNPPAPPSPPVLQVVTTSSSFGLNSHIASRHREFETLETAVDATAGLGVTWVREDFQFNRIWEGPNQFNWDWHDRTINLLRQRNIQVIGVLNQPIPGWANGGQAAGVPPDPQRFATFAAEVVNRYKDRIQYWQIWNEPDNANYWAPQPDPVAYANLLKIVYPAIKAADPNAQVLIGGLVSPSPALEFLRQVHANGAWNSFDIIALNPYADPFIPENKQIGITGIGAVRSLASGFGAKPIWATEFGWSSGPADRNDKIPPIDEATQANYLVRSMALLSAAGAEKILWYKLKDDNPNNNLYGLVRYGSSDSGYDPGLYKPAYSFFQVLNQQLAGTNSATSLEFGDQQNVFGFEQPTPWTVAGQANGTLTQSSEQVYSGANAAKLSYNFRTTGNDFVVFTAPRGIRIPDGTSKLGIWVYGDGSAHELKVRLRDSQGEELQFRLGPVGERGWQFISTPITMELEDGNVISGRQNKRLDFPASLTEIVLDDSPDVVQNSGTIYLDDLTAFVGPETYAVRFNNGSEVVDVIWAPQATQINLPTNSTRITRVRAWGEQTEEQVTNGLYTFVVGPDPVYIRHIPRR